VKADMGERDPIVTIEDHLQAVGQPVLSKVDMDMRCH